MQSLPYFASSVMAPMFEVYEVYDKPEHEAYKALLNDLNEISGEQVLFYVNESEIKHLFGRHKTIIDRKLLIFIFLISNEIDALRIRHLLSRSILPPLPYNHPELSATELDNNFLVKSSDFNTENGGICTPNTAFILLPGTDAINSSYWLHGALFSIGHNELIRVRLDPLIYAPVESFNPMMYKMQVYGTVFNWNRIKALRNIEHTQFLPEFPSSGDIERTDVVWKPVDDEIHFTCEEMPKSERLSVRGSRYFHAIFQRDSGILKHCDAAIRFYTDEEYQTRLSRHIKANEVTRIGKRIKVFQIDVPKDQVLSQPITHQHFINLVTSFYVWNEDVLNYFNSN
ncbi:MAG: hypothetical protein ABI675_25665 [Chitinophagaceae bacterium]